jgi:hypothetical protein
MEEGRKLVLAIVAGIFVARHIKTADDLCDSQRFPRTESLIASAVSGENESCGRLIECSKRSKEIGNKKNRKERPLSMQKREEVQEVLRFN